MTHSADQNRLISIINHGSRLLGLSLTRDSVLRMLRHLELVAQWNKQINLTSLRKPEELAVFHCLDSLTTLRVIPRREALSILDIGTGAGFPGLIIKNVYTEADLTLLDNHPGKIVFLKYVAKEIGLQRVFFRNCPVRQLLDTNNEYYFDLIVSRAFSSDPVFLDSLHKLLRPGGFLIRMSGPASHGKDYNLKNFTVSAFWQGFVPYSSSFRRVILYSTTPGPCPDFKR